MSRKAAYILITSLGVCIVLGCAIAGGGYLYLQHRAQKLLADAEKAYAEGRYFDAKNYFSWYLVRHNRDLNALSKFADASTRLMENRTQTLRDAGRAYFQIAIQHPDAAEYQDHVLTFLESHRLWNDLDYCATFFLRTHPSDQKLIYYKALAQEKLGHVKEAVDRYTALVETKTNRPDVYGQLILLLQLQGYPEQATKFLKQFEETFGSDPQVLRYTLRFYMQTRNVDKAEQAASSILEKAQEDPESLLAVGQFRLQQGRYDEATSLIEKALKRTPERSDACLFLANAYQELGKSEKAIQFLEGLPITLKADYAELLFAQAELELSMRQYDGAHQTIDAYRRLYPEHWIAFDYLEARELLEKGQAPEAAKRFATVAKNNPDFHPSKYYQAQAYLQSNQYDLAKSTLEAYLRAVPTDQHALQLWKKTFDRPKVLDDALKVAHEVDKQANVTQDQLITAASDLNQFNEGVNSNPENTQLARNLLEKAIAQAPQQAEAYLALANIFNQGNDFAKADALFEQAMSAGVPPEKLAMARAATALLNNQPNKAQEFLEQRRTKNDISLSETFGWAQLFTEKGYLDKGIEILVQAKGKDESTDREIDLKQISLCILAGNADHAIDIAAKLERKIITDSELRRKLSDCKLEIARALLDTQDPDALEKVNGLLDEVQHWTPENEEIALLRGRLLLAGPKPDLEQADQIGKRALEKDCKNINALLLRYHVAMSRDRIISAADYAQRALASSPTDYHTHLALAEALVHCERFKEAQRPLENVHTARPKEIRPLELLVQTYGELKNLPKAIAAFTALKSLATSNPTKNDVLLRRTEGILNLYEGDESKAENLFQEILREKPDDFETLKSYCLLLERHQENSTTVEKVIKTFTEKNPSDVRGWTQLGTYYLQQNTPENLTRASSAFGRATYLQADYVPALRGMIFVQGKMNNIGNALGLCNRYLALEPVDTEILKEKASMLIEDPLRQEEALETITRAIEYSEKPDYLTIRSEILMKLGKYQEALTDLQHVANTYAISPAATDAAIALVYSAMNERDLAMQYFRSAMTKTNDKDPIPSALLKQLLERLEGKKQ